MPRLTQATRRTGILENTLTGGPADETGEEEIERNGAKRQDDQRSRLEPGHDRDDRQQGPGREQRDIAPAPMRNAQGVEELHRREGQCGERDDAGKADPFRRLQQVEVECREIPHSGKAAEVIVRGLHLAVGEIEAPVMTTIMPDGIARNSGISPLAAIA